MKSNQPALYPRRRQVNQRAPVEGTLTTTVSREPGEKLVTLGKTRTMELEAPLTDTERAGLNAQVAAVSAETFSLEEEKKKAVAPLNEKLKDAKSRERDLLAQLKSGTTKKPVAVRTRADLFRGEKWVERLDLGEPEEVPESRSALTDAERQLMIPGFRVEGGVDDRPDAEVLQLRSVDGNDEESAGTTVTWAQALPEPLERWKLEKAGSAYQVVNTNTWQVFGTFSYVHGKGLHWTDSTDGQLPEEHRAGLEVAAGGSLQVAALLSTVADTLREHLASAPVEDVWSSVLPPPRDHWTVAEEKGEASASRLFIINDSTNGKTWGPYAWKDAGFVTVDQGVPVPDEDFNALGAYLAPEGDEEERDRAAGDLLKAAEELVAQRMEMAAEQERFAAVPEGGLVLHPLPGIEGWALYLHEGHGYLRPPNMDRFTPPGHASDKGPLEWDQDGGRWEPGDTAPLELDGWVREQVSLMKCADSLVRQGKVTPPGVEKAPADETAEDGGETTTAPEADHARAATKLSDHGKAVLRLLAGETPPVDALTIGNKGRCKGGSVLNGLKAKGLVEKRIGEGEVETWHITELGRTVAAALPAGK